MGRLLTTGLESTTEYDTLLDTATIVTSGHVRSGAAAGRVTAPTVNVANGFKWTADPGGVTNARFYRFYLYIASLPNATTCIFSIAAGIGAYGLSLTSAGVLATESNVGIAGSTTLSAGQWYRIEVHIDNTGAGATDVFEFRVDGVTIASSSTLALANNPSAFSIGANIGVLNRGATACDLYFEDVAMNDTSGATQNSWPGPGSVVNLYPAAAGDNTTFAIQGSSPAATNWQSVKEHPADDGVTYVERSTTGVKTDDYKVDSPATAGIGATDTITLVHVRLRGGSTSATVAVARRLLTRIKSAVAGTVHKAAGAGVQATTGGTAGIIPLNTTTWVTDLVSTVGSFPQLVSYVDPTTGVAWTRDGTNSLSNMQIGIETENSSTTVVRASTVWAVVEYVPPQAVSDSETATGTDAGESVAAAASDTETSAGTDAEAVAAAASDTETGAGTDAGEAIAGTASGTDTGAGADAEAVAATFSDTDTGAGTDLEAIAAAFADTEAGAGSDTETVASGISDTDTASAVDAEGAALAPTDGESGAGTDVEALAVALSDDDPATGTDAGEAVAASVTDDEPIQFRDLFESATATFSDDDPAAAVDAEGLAVAPADDDPAGGIDTEAIAAAATDVEVAAIVDDQALQTTFTDDDAALLAEGAVVLALVAGADSATAVEAQNATTSTPGGGGWLVGASHL